MFNPVAPYGYLLPNVYLFMADIENPDLSVCVCRTWICLDITRFYEEQRQPSSGSPKETLFGPPLLGAGGFDAICTVVCNRCDSYTTCRLCRLEPVNIHHQWSSSLSSVVIIFLELYVERHSEIRVVGDEPELEVIKANRLVFEIVKISTDLCMRVSFYSIS